MGQPDASEPRAPPPGHRQAGIAAFTALALVAHLALRYAVRGSGQVLGLPPRELPLVTALAFGGVPLVLGLYRNLLRREFGSDLLAGLAIVSAVLLGELLVGTLVVLMLSGGAALEAYGVCRASSALAALARRMPAQAHRRQDGGGADVPLDRVAVGDTLICPVDGTVLGGHGTMDESYLTGEPYQLSKTPGSAVLSGAVNGATALTIRADKLAVDSRLAKSLQILRAAEQRRPRLRRLGAFYTPLAVAIAIGAWAVSGQPVRFLAVLVVATPCPLLIAIPVAILGSVSLAAARGIIVKDPAVLEQIDTCRTAVFDKTGTLTYGRPELTGLDHAAR
jgi:cation transport ATPase